MIMVSNTVTMATYIILLATILINLFLTTGQSLTLFLHVTNSLLTPILIYQLANLLTVKN